MSIKRVVEAELDVQSFVCYSIHYAAEIYERYWYVYLTGDEDMVLAERLGLIKKFSSSQEAMNFMFEKWPTLKLSDIDSKAEG